MAISRQPGWMPLRQDLGTRHRIKISKSITVIPVPPGAKVAVIFSQAPYTYRMMKPLQASCIEKAVPFRGYCFLLDGGASLQVQSQDGTNSEIEVVFI